MSNLINNILTNEKTATSSATTSTTDQVIKDKPSLFDSLLSGSTTAETKVNTEAKQEIKETKSDTFAAVKSEEVKLDEVIVDNLNKEESDVTEEVDTRGQKTSLTSSLLDRLILEAKNSAKEIASGDNQVKNTLTDLKLEEVAVANSKDNLKVDAEINKVGTEEIAITSKEELKVVDKSVIEQPKILDKDDNKGQKETKTSSLLDKLIVEVKNDNKEVITDQNEKLTNLDSNLEVIKDQIKVSNEVEAEKTVTVIKLDETKVDNKKTEVKPAETIAVIKLDETKVDNKRTEVKPAETVSIIKLDETNVDNKKTEAKNDISKLIEKIDVKVENDTILINKETKNINDVSKDISIQKEIVTTSLLDDLSIESNNVVVNSSLKEIVTDNSSQFNQKSELNINNQSLTSNIDENANINELEKIDIKKDVKISLMDQLIQKNSEKLVLDNVNSISEDLNMPLKDVVVKDLISNIYLGSQKNKITNQNLFNKNEAISLLKDGNSIQSVKTSAEMLDLGLESVNVEQDITLDNLDTKKSNIDLLNRKNLIDNLLVKNDIRGEEVKDLITKSIEASNALIDNTLTVADDTTVNVNSPLSYNIQSRIIGAKQQMSAMMSDIAKQMYENYKPPVTAFKINLNPLDLGSIAILMKNDKNNGLTISMSVSNNVTLDTLIENQNVLKNSLNKTFDENTKFNLDFSSSNQNNNSNQSSNNGQGNNRRFEQQMDTKSILELQEENKDREEKVIDYM